jgi:alkanesulfonate monooxygenase SsuD/methylene tetrahydromethanopterin reductase-like flavin-dependent oxidoreductase (luciferase family)
MSGFRWGLQPITYSLTWAEAAQAAQAVDRLGLDYLWAGDHLYSTGGDPYQPFFEGWTTLGAWAALTSNVRLGMLVAANPFRNPGLVAKMASTLDHISGGRFVLGIGAGNRELEASAHGIDPGGSMGQRLDWLDEALGIVRGILDGESVTHHSQRYQFTDVHQHPTPVQSRLPLVVGAEGERKGLRIAARHADIWQIWLPMDGLETWKRKERVLQEHCQEIGRDHSTIERAVGGRLVLRATPQEAQRVWEEEVRVHDWKGPMTTFSWVGTPDQVAEAIVGFRAAGADGFTASIAAPLDLETIERLATEVRPWVEAASGP